MTVAAPRNSLLRDLPGTALAGWLVVALLPGIAPLAAAQAESPGFEVRSAGSVLVDGMWYVNARVDCRLTARAEAALRGGVPLRFRVEVELDRVRSFWPDATVTRVAREEELSYRPLTEQFVVRDSLSDEEQAFGSLFGALESIGRVTQLPLISATELPAGEPHLVWLRAGLDREGMPGQSALFAYWGGRFAMASEWYQWPLRN